VLYTVYDGAKVQVRHFSHPYRDQTLRTRLRLFDSATDYSLVGFIWSSITTNSDGLDPASGSIQ
jgi:hypothetical protein